MWDIIETLWTVTYQALLSVAFSRQEYWNGLPFPSSGYLSDQGIKPMSSASSTLTGGFFTTEPPGILRCLYILEFNPLLVAHLQIFSPILRVVFLSFFSFIFISWRLITSQHCSGFCHTLTWISPGVTCIPHPDPPTHIPPSPSPTESKSLLCTSVSHFLFCI